MNDENQTNTDNIDEPVITTQPIAEDIPEVPEVPVENIPEEKNNLQSATVHVKYKTNCDKLEITNKATQEKNTIVAANKTLRLIHGRLYFIPVDLEINSDEYGNIKQYSETSDKFKIRYIKNGVACIDPIQHNTVLNDGQKLCIIW